MASLVDPILGDLYLSLGEPLGAGSWRVRIQYKPFVGWIWGGAILMAIGGGLAESATGAMSTRSANSESPCQAHERGDPCRHGLGCRASSHEVHRAAWGFHCLRRGRR